MNELQSVSYIGLSYVCFVLVFCIQKYIINITYYDRFELQAVCPGNVPEPRIIIVKQNGYRSLTYLNAHQA